MAVSTYETIFIADPDIQNDQVDTIVNKIKQTITSKNGNVTGEDRWGRRRLAYSVQGHREGFYTILNFTADGTVVTDLDHYFRVTDSILRHMTLKIIKKNKTFAPRRERPTGAAEGARPGARPGGFRRPAPTVTPPPGVTPTPPPASASAPTSEGAAS